jgi:predicted metal-dependent phosphoesterase TrpH
MLKIDLHTHSVYSPDGGITAEQYKRAITDRILDYIAITDHNGVDFALDLQKELKDKIIVGQEVLTKAGEIIGLFLTEKIKSKQTPIETIRAIKDQGGIVYIPHPLEKIRHGLQIDQLDNMVDHIDVVEIGNGRTLLQEKYEQIAVWANLNNLIVAASSDAHGFAGLGKTYTLIDEAPSRENFLKVLSAGSLIVKRPSIRALLYPKYNRIINRY